MAKQRKFNTDYRKRQEAVEQPSEPGVLEQPVLEAPPQESEGFAVRRRYSPTLPPTEQTPSEFITAVKGVLESPNISPRISEGVEQVKKGGFIQDIAGGLNIGLGVAETAISPFAKVFQLGTATLSEIQRQLESIVGLPSSATAGEVIDKAFELAGESPDAGARFLDTEFKKMGISKEVLNLGMDDDDVEALTGVISGGSSLMAQFILAKGAHSIAKVVTPKAPAPVKTTPLTKKQVKAIEKTRNGKGQFAKKPTVEAKPPQADIVKETIEIENIKGSDVFKLTEDIPTPIVIKGAQKILGDKFKSELAKFEEKNPPVKGLDPAIAEGWVVENFARRIVAVDKLAKKPKVEGKPSTPTLIKGQEKRTQRLREAEAERPLTGRKSLIEETEQSQRVKLDKAKIDQTDVILKKIFEFERLKRGGKPLRKKYYTNLIKNEVKKLNALKVDTQYKGGKLFIDGSRIVKPTRGVVSEGSIFESHASKISPTNQPATFPKEGGKVATTERRTGFFAPKEVETAEIRDIDSGFLSPYNMALKQDGFKKGGKFGYVNKKVWTPVKEQLAKDIETQHNFANEFNSIVNRNKFKKSARNGRLLSDWLENKKPVPNRYKEMVKDIRSYLDDKRLQSNRIRKQMNKDQIDYISNYVPHIQKTTIWNELMKNDATVSGGIDYIIPNEVKNPFAMQRLKKEMLNPERNFFKLVDRYNVAISKDINITPTIEYLKANIKAFKEKKLPNTAQYWEEYIKSGLLGKSHKIDQGLGIGVRGRKALRRWNNAVNLAFLTGKLAWNFATQPLSYITLTTAEAGFLPTIKAPFKMFHKDIRQYARQNSLSLRIKSGDILSTAVGEGRDYARRIYRTPIDKYNSILNILGSIEEQILHETSFVAGLEAAKKLGYKGKDAIGYADLVAERSQSMYSKETRARILNSDVLRAVQPFQNFAVEMLNHAKEIVGRGAMDMTTRQRLGKLMRLTVGVYLANYYSQALTGRKKTSVGTFVPFLGAYVDMIIAEIRGKEYIGDRTPLVAFQQAKEVSKGIKDYLKHGNLRRLRKVGINFGLGLSGIGGGAQLNNIIDGTMAIINEEVKSVEGKKLFDVKDAESKIKAPIFGIWSTKGGRDYWDQRTDEDFDTSLGRRKIDRSTSGRKQIDRTIK